jgi:hypothetical protein
MGKIWCSSCGSEVKLKAICKRGNEDGLLVAKWETDIEEENPIVGVGESLVEAYGSLLMATMPHESGGDWGI